MSVTVTPTVRETGPLMGKMAVVADLALTGTYATAGFALTAAMFGLMSLDDVIFMDSVAAAASAGSGFVPQFVRGTKKVKLFRVGPTSGIKQDIFPYVKAAKVAADDIVGTAVYSNITGGSSLLGANYNFIVTTAVPSNGVTLTIAHQPDVSRNVTICCHNINGGTVANAATSYLVTGTYNGAAQTETITIPAVSMANGTCIYKSGAKPFDSITSIVPTITGGTEVSGFEVIVGIGGLIGLSQSLLTPAEADVLMVTQTAVPVAISSIVSATNNTVKFTTITANDYLVVKYACSGGPTAAAALAEHGSGVTVASPVLRVLALGV